MNRIRKRRWERRGTSRNRKRKPNRKREGRRGRGRGSVTTEAGQVPTTGS